MQQSPCISVSAIITCRPQDRVLREDPSLLKTGGFLKRFLSLTAGEVLIVGHNACTLLCKGDGGGISFLLGRQVIALSPLVKRPVNGPFITLADSAQRALAIAEEAQAREIFVFGGEKVYAAFFPITRRVYLVGTNDRGTDKLFPELKSDEWRLGEQEEIATLERI